MRRRDMLRTSGGAAVAAMASGLPALPGCAGGPPAASAPNKRQLVLDLLDAEKSASYVPAGFFIHFGEENHVGQTAIDKHVEYFRYTGMDFVKIQYEAGFPLHPEVERPEDWARLPHLPYDDLTPFLEYPGDVVNCSLHVGEETLTPKDASELFSRPYMGGLDRKGVIVNGTADEIRQEVHDVLAHGADRQVLAADCTLPGDTAWENIRTAIAAAHDFRG